MAGRLADLIHRFIASVDRFTDLLGRGIAWLDTGTHEALLQAANFIQAIQDRQGLKVACLEEIAFRQGYIDRARLRDLGEAMKKNEYGRYMLRLAEEFDV